MGRRMKGVAQERQGLEEAGSPGEDSQHPGVQGTSGAIQAQWLFNGIPAV